MFLCSPGVVLACKVHIVQSFKNVFLALIIGTVEGPLLDLFFMIDTEVTFLHVPIRQKKEVWPLFARISKGSCLPGFEKAVVCQDLKRQLFARI